jgi:hypothetical protein
MRQSGSSEPHISETTSNAGVTVENELGGNIEAHKVKNGKKPKCPKEPKKQQTLIESALVKNHDGKDDSIPDNLKSVVSQTIWSKWSPVRRESFKQMMANPGSFFYRNRPPGDPQKFGGFTREEEVQFIERLTYFQNVLHITDGCWGLFSIPIRGRVGYQCSNFYRQLIKDGKIFDDRYQIQPDGKLKFMRDPLDKPSVNRPPPKSMAILESEAIKFIDECMALDDAQVVEPIRVSDPVRQSSRCDCTLPSVCGKSRGLPERRMNMLLEIEIRYGGKNPGLKAKQDSEERDRCPLIGAIDPISKEPMMVPMMDEGGFVMDLSSWRKVFYEDYVGPYAILAEKEADLVPLTRDNFRNLRLRIANFAC